MVFIDQTSNTQIYKPTLGQDNIQLAIGLVHIACFAQTTAQRLALWQGRVGSQSDLPCLNGAPNPTRPQVLVFFYWLVCIKEAGCSRTKLTALAGSMVSNGRHIIIGRVGKYCAQSSPRSALSGKRPRPTALFPLHKAQAGQVALAPNPALPKD